MRRLRRAVGLIAVAAGVVASTPMAMHAAQLPQATPTPPTKPAPPPSDYAFPSVLVMFVFYVKPDKAADFDAVVVKLNQVLNASTDPQRKQQAASWRIFKSAEASKDELVYVFFFDPAVTGTEYDPIK